MPDLTSPQCATLGVALHVRWLTALDLGPWKPVIPVTLLTLTPSRASIATPRSLKAGQRVRLTLSNPHHQLRELDARVLSVTTRSDADCEAELELALDDLDKSARSAADFILQQLLASNS